MLSYLCLLGAIIFEVSGTLLLPVSENFTKPIPTAGLTVCYLIGFFLLTFAIRSIPISIVYATWSGLGVFFVAIFGHFVYRELLLAGGFRLSHDHLRGHSGEYLQPGPWLKGRSPPEKSNGCR